MKRKRKPLPYNPKLVPLARRLRNNSTLAEILLWQRLKKKQVLGYDFHRQKPLGNYIVDFFCPELRLGIEIDGASHRFNEEADCRRQRKLEAMGVELVRFTDRQVKQEIEEVVEEICWHIRRLNR